MGQRTRKKFQPPDPTSKSALGCRHIHLSPVTRHSGEGGGGVSAVFLCAHKGLDSWDLIRFGSACLVHNLPSPLFFMWNFRGAMNSRATESRKQMDVHNTHSPFAQFG